MSKHYRYSDYSDKTSLSFMSLMTVVSEVHLCICDIVDGIPIIMPFGIKFLLKGMMTITINGAIICIAVPIILIKNIFTL